MFVKRLIFCGTPAFAASSLTQLATLGFDEILVLTKPDAQKGRGLSVYPSQVKVAAQALALAVQTPNNKQELADAITTFNPDAIVVVAYGMMFPKEIVDTYLCINIHGSILPSYRGASPIHAALLNNDAATGITLIKMNEGMDAGAVLETVTLFVSSSDNLETLHDKLAVLGAETITTFMAKLTTLSPPSTPQDIACVSFCKKLVSDDFILDPTDSLQTNLGKIRAFSPRPGATVLVHNKRIKILSAHSEDNKLIPDMVKPEGKQAMTYKDYCLGHPDGLPF